MIALAKINSNNFILQINRCLFVKSFIVAGANMVNRIKLNILHAKYAQGWSVVGCWQRKRALKPRRILRIKHLIGVFACIPPAYFLRVRKQNIHINISYGCPIQQENEIRIKDGINV